MSTAYDIVDRTYDVVAAGPGPKIHCMIRELGGVRVEFDGKTRLDAPGQHAA